MLSLDSQIFCQNCANQFNDNNLPRMLTMCGHTYCQTCILKMIQQNNDQEETQNSKYYFVQCPEDATRISIQKKDIKIFPKNLALMKVLECKKNNSSFKDQFFDLSKIVKQQEIAQDLSSDQLIKVMDEGSQSETSKMSKFDSSLDNEIKQPQNSLSRKQQTFSKDSTLHEEAQQQLCLLHQKPLEIICLNHQQKICSKCAIFGQHKGHQFKGIQEVVQQTNTCYMKILEFFQEKQEIQKRMSNIQTESALIDVLNKKRDLLQKQVKQEYRKLRQQTTKQEKKVLRKLQQNYRLTELKIKNLLKIEESIKNNYLKFEQQSFQIIKILQGVNLQDKIQLLYQKNGNKLKILQVGQNIIKQLQNQEHNLIVKVQQLLSTLQCKKSKKIFDTLNEFVDIINEQKKSQEQIKIQIPKKILKQEPKVFKQINIIQPKKIYPCLQGSPLLQQSLLDIQESMPNKIQIRPFQEFKVEIFNPQSTEIYRPLTINNNLINRDFTEKSISSNFSQISTLEVNKIPSLKFSNQKNLPLQLDQSFNDKKRTSIMSNTKRLSLIPKMQNDQKPTKKKLKSIKVPQKYQKILDGIFNNTLDVIDLTNGQLGDNILLQICQFVKHSKARTIKFIRNKLTDQGVQKMLPMLANAQILNLSQNNLTENVLDIMIANRYGHLSGLKNLILSQNKIIQRKHKVKIDQLRAMNLTVSV